MANHDDEAKQRRLAQAFHRMDRMITDPSQMDPTMRAIAEKMGLIGNALTEALPPMGREQVPRLMEPLAEPGKHFGEAVRATERPTSLNRFAVDPIKDVPLTKGGMLDPESGLGRATGQPGGIRNWVEGVVGFPEAVTEADVGPYGGSGVGMTQPMDRGVADLPGLRSNLWSRVGEALRRIVTTDWEISGTEAGAVSPWPQTPEETREYMAGWGGPSPETGSQGYEYPPDAAPGFHFGGPSPREGGLGYEYPPDAAPGFHFGGRPEADLMARAREAPWSPEKENVMLHGIKDPYAPALGPKPGPGGQTPRPGAPGEPGAGAPADKTAKVGGIGGDDVIHVLRGTTESFWRGNESGGVEYPSEFHAYNAKRDPKTGKLEPPWLTEKDLIMHRADLKMRITQAEGQQKLLEAWYGASKVITDATDPVTGENITAIKTVNPNNGEIILKPVTDMGLGGVAMTMRNELVKKNYHEVASVLFTFKEVEQLTDPQAKQTKLFLDSLTEMDPNFPLWLQENQARYATTETMKSKKKGGKWLEGAVKPGEKGASRAEHERILSKKREKQLYRTGTMDPDWDFF